MKRFNTKKTKYLPKDRLLMLVGNYGSGKTEVAVNLAISLAQSGLAVQIADLDIVNPYFRCREAWQLMKEHGIRVVVPSEPNRFADLPIVLPEIKGMLNPTQGQVSIFDVGGDEVGAKLLSSLIEPLGDAAYALWLVINARRPFTDTVDGCLRMLSAIEHASRLKVNGLVVNTHLMEETTPKIILEGYHLAQQVGKPSGLPIEFVAMMQALVESHDWQELETCILPLRRHMLPPWLRPSQSGTCPSPNRRAPIGRPHGAN